jgi:hypothetical protein
VDVSDVVDVLEILAASIFRVDPGDGCNMYLQNISNIVYNRMV